MKLDLQRAALVVIDPQIDFLSPKGGAWSILGESVTEQKTVQNLARLLEASKRAKITVAVSPHFYYPYDHTWKFGNRSPLPTGAADRKWF
jgi:nicotinamidase-related amidase